MTAERRANYLERVAAAGARTIPSAKPAVVVPPCLPGMALAPLPILLPEPSESAEFTAAPGWTVSPADRLEREPPSAIRPESATHPTAFGQPPAEQGIAPQPDVEATQHVHEPPASQRLPLPSAALSHGSSSMPRANTPAPPIAIDSNASASGFVVQTARSDTRRPRTGLPIEPNSTSRGDPGAASESDPWDAVT